MIANEIIVSLFHWSFWTGEDTGKESVVERQASWKGKRCGKAQMFRRRSDSFVRASPHHHYHVLSASDPLPSSLSVLSPRSPILHTHLLSPFATQQPSTAHP